MYFLFKFRCSTTQAHFFFCSHFHNLNGKEREKKDKIYEVQNSSQPKCCFSCYLTVKAEEFQTMPVFVSNLKD